MKIFNTLSDQVEEFKPIEDGLVGIFTRAIEKKFTETGIVFHITRRFENFAEIEIKTKKEDVRLHLGYDSPFRFDKPVHTRLFQVNDYVDLVVDKFLAFYGRVEPRDAIDLFFILKAEDFYEVASLAKKKDPGFDLYWMAVALRKVKDFPDDITRWPVEMVEKVKAESIKKKFLKIF